MWLSFAEFTERECGLQLPNRSLSESFGLTASHVSTIRLKARKKQKAPHRPLSLTDDREKAIREILRERAIAGTYVTEREVLNFLRRNSGKL
jgi:hypothetical protein